MVRYIVAVYKRLNVGTDRKSWSNVYHVEAEGLEGALDLGVSIANIEQQVHKDYVLFQRCTAIEDQIDPPPGGSRVLTGLGDVEGDDTLRLPPFCTVRVLFSDGNGRPSQKYLRLPLQEDDIVDGTINTTVNNLIVTGYVSDLLSLVGFVSNTGNTFTEGAVVPAIQMRQTDWKRRTRPGFIRGWVAV